MEGQEHCQAWTCHLGEIVHHFNRDISPKWARNKIDKIGRGFICNSDDYEHATGGHSLVNWKTVCRPKYLGGLGIANLERFGRALRLRWSWFAWNDTDMPWVGSRLSWDEADMGLFWASTTITLGKEERRFSGTITRWVGDPHGTWPRISSRLPPGSGGRFILSSTTTLGCAWSQKLAPSSNSGNLFIFGRRSPSSTSSLIVRTPSPGSGRPMGSTRLPRPTLRNSRVPTLSSTPLYFGRRTQNLKASCLAGSMLRKLYLICAKTALSPLQ